MTPRSIEAPDTVHNENEEFITLQPTENLIFSLVLQPFVDFRLIAAMVCNTQVGDACAYQFGDGGSFINAGTAYGTACQFYKKRGWQAYGEQMPCMGVAGQPMRKTL